ncbi:MAG: CoB--CoM heterodisulfide reductase iron-sulfur subunit A family protein [Dehalococcoidia bacterium]|nr:CoB--CoM heterodisulfide reductase iron-sulfur subunit A family protein [Dehalococcoidia bacterium]
MKRIGVFICHCGLNIAGTVDVKRVVETIKDYPGVVHAESYIYMCSDPGQDLVRRAIREKGLDGVVMANCSPSMHEKTFRNVVAKEGLNPYFCEVANIREHCSWPHEHEKELATKKALLIIETTIEKLKRNMELTPMVVPLHKRALVIGGGIAGMQAALDIASAGYEVIIVEKLPTIGGHAIQLAGTFPTLNRVPCLMAPRMAEIASHPKIKLYTCAEVEDISGYVGNFAVKIKTKPSYINEERCNNCELCLGECPVTLPAEFDRGLSQRKAIYLTPREAIPQKLLIDPGSCLHFNGNECHACEEICPTKAIDFLQQETIAEEVVGAIVVATGYEIWDKMNVPEYASDPDVIDGLQFERILSPSGPTGGEIRRPSDGKVPKEVVFISCVGSRDPEHGFTYCSRVCCMYIAKQAVLYSRTVPEGQAYVFYMDIRSDSKGYEEFVKRAVEEERVLYLRGRVSKVFRDGDKIKVWGSDTLSGKSIEIAADLVILATAMTPSEGAKELARKLNVTVDALGFLTEAHPKLRPVETLTTGIYLAGTAQWPRDIPDTISSSSGAASKVISLFSRKELLHEPTVAWPDEEVCSGCGICASICAYHAIEIDPKRRVARVNEAVCEGCGACIAACPSGAMRQKNWTAMQFFEMLDVATGAYV